MRRLLFTSFPGSWSKSKVNGKAALFALSIMTVISAAVVYADYSENMTYTEFLAVPATGDTAVSFSAVDITFSNTNLPPLYYSLTGSAGSWQQIPLTTIVPGYMAQGSFSISDISQSTPIYMAIGKSFLTGGTLDFAGTGTTPNDKYNSVSVAWGDLSNATFVTPITSNGAGVSDRVAPVYPNLIDSSASLPPSVALLGSGLVSIIGFKLWRQKRRLAKTQRG